MTSYLLPMQVLRCTISPNRSSVPLHTNNASYLVVNFSSAIRAHHSRFQHRYRASTEGIPSELTDDPKFVPLNKDDPTYGPPALLLMGFETEEMVKIEELLRELGGEFLKVIFCTEDMLARSLWDAMHTEQPDLRAVKVAKSLPRLCILSGLTGEETIMFIDAFPDSGLEPVVFAALVPNSANKLLGDVMEEIMGDHELMTAKKQPDV